MDQHPRSPKAVTSSCGRCSVRTRTPTRPQRSSAGVVRRSRPTPRAFVWGLQLLETGRPPRCARSARAACGEVFVPEIGPAPGTSARSSAATACVVSRRIRWPRPPKHHLRLRPPWSSPRTTGGLTAEWMTAGRTSAHASPMSIYEVHLGSWRQGLSYQQLAEELTNYVVAHGFTHVEFLPVMEHPFGGSWGYQVSAYTRPPHGSATRRLPPSGGPTAPSGHRRDRGLGPGALPPTSSPSPVSTAPPVRARRSAAGRTPRLGHVRLRLRPPPEVRNFLVANAVYWCEEFHIDGLRVDAVASMLYLDYSRNEGRMVPNAYGGRREPDAVTVPAGDEHHRLQAQAGRVHRR